ncbi:hypothetical protein [Paenibacillus glacialis]|uniref:Prolipoprotein diacylglyceryl transferase n=1 Tax=Paenibacillus glacialis TaxID=494026 RepID=A0A168KU90_9BACL|nr:hypothetical protein [Paenibacillus glacialis]OAB42470.1 hypothetical protein PGLA_12430 [Paenibacillus glacialis]
MKRKGVEGLNVIQIGPLVLNLELLIFILSAFIGYLALKYRLKKAAVAVDGNVSDKFVNALILGFVIWKGSLIIFDPMSVIQYPMSLLYFSGGEKGLWLAITISILYIWIRTRKDGTSIMMNLDLLLAGWIASSVMYHLLLLTLNRENVLYHSLNIVLNIVLSLYCYTRKKPVFLSRFMIWYSVIMIGVSFAEKDRTFFVFGFTKVQMIYFILFIIFLWIDTALDKERREEAH